jgi:hypothetical protein
MWKKLALAGALVAAVAIAALAANAPTYTDVAGRLLDAQGVVLIDTTGQPYNAAGSGGAAPNTVTGNVASGAADSGNPVKVGGVYNSTLPTFTNGQRGDLQVGVRGALNVSIFNAAGVSPVNATTVAADAVSAGSVSLAGQSFLHVFNGASWDRQFTCASQTSATVTAAATTQLVALSGSTNIRVCSYQVGIATTGTYKFVSGTGSNCGTGTADLTPATNLTAGNVVAMSAGNNSIFRAGASNALCLAAVTGNVQVFVSYAQF